ncbi:hypothetical protein ABIE09_001594 [Lysobacter enzymogenes]|jgi:hypothetical protein|uniref:hypothetical protein n=1 Tax=Lysobacter enzymogenes TaxID=69 RepID=UPI00089D1286|nr:hypothetical protein [Lysobacter enzymogenes]SDX15438.1 hypothetical protein SAMN05421681_10436 [Lysobacter enzymogenes]
MKMGSALLALAAAFACCPAAYAGHQYYDGEVSIYLPGRGAAGTLNVARRSADPNAQIGCTIKYGVPTSTYPYPGLTQVYVTCVARNSQGRVDCISVDPAVIDIARTIVPTSFVAFSANESGLCVRLSVSNDSAYLP